jgi:hypothetical protein
VRRKQARAARTERGLRQEALRSGTPAHRQGQLRLVPGVLFQDPESARELVLLERWAPGITVAVSLPSGIELLVLDGSFIEGGEEFTRLSWLRLPAGATLQATAGRGGCEVWVKSGHLAHAPRLPAAASPVLPSTPPATNKGARWDRRRRDEE